MAIMARLRVGVKNIVSREYSCIKKELTELMVPLIPRYGSYKLARIADNASWCGRRNVSGVFLFFTFRLLFILSDSVGKRKRFEYIHNVDVPQCPHA